MSILNVLIRESTNQQQTGQVPAKVISTTKKIKSETRGRRGEGRGNGVFGETLKPSQP
jgi:hypothetical protein